MKRVITLMLLFLMLAPNVVSAHADLESSQPKEGETVKQSIDTLTLQFGEDVEKFISFTISNGNGESIPVDTPNISGKTVLVMTKKPLPQGNYTAKWELVAADGHDNTGQLSFKVGQVLEKKTKAEAPVKTDTADQHQTNDQTSNHQTLYISIIAVLVVLILIGGFAVLRKNRK